MVRAAPAMQVMLTAQFASQIPDFNALKMASFFAWYAEEFPNYMQVPQAGPMPYRIAHLIGLEDINAAPMDAPRMQFSSADDQWKILIQADRISFSWSKTDPNDAEKVYPGFEEFAPRFIEYLNRIITKSLPHKLEIVPHVIELAYVNMFPLYGESGEPLKLSNTYSFLSKTTSPQKVFNFHYQWSEILESVGGILSIMAQGPINAAAESSQSMLSLIGAFEIEGGGMAGVSEGIYKARAEMREVFHRVVFPERLATY